MKALSCQLCQKIIPEKDLFHHLVKVHKWKVHIERKDQSEPKDTVSKANKTLKKKKGLWQKSPELLTCPHCEKRFKLKQVLIDHIQKCSAKKTESNTKGVTNKVIGNGFSYEWASKQKLDKKFEGVMSKLALEKDIEYLSKEINSLVARLNTDPNDSKAQNRLILVAKAKKSILKKQKKTKSNNKKKGKQNSNLKTDAMDYRVPGSWGAGKNR